MDRRGAGRRGFLAALGLALALAACAPAVAPPSAPVEVSRPRLAVLLVVDGMPAWQATAYRDALAPDGLRRFLDRGAVYEEARYLQAHTVTASGHAVLLTGAYPDRTGIVGNEWYEPATGRLVHNSADEAHHYLGGEPTQPEDGTSPANLRVESLGDVMKSRDPRSKVVALSGKDRGAILPGGHRGTAYVYRAATGHFASSTYYRASHPAWVQAFNAAASPPASRDPTGMDERTIAFARAAVVGESLGADDAPDLLAVSLSGHDYVNHEFGAESERSREHLLRVDAMIQEFLRFLDATVGEGRYVAALTADHGFTPLPELSRSLGRDAGRVDFRRAVARINAGLEAAFGPGRWVRGVGAMGIVFDRGTAAARGADLDRVAAEAKRLLLAEPGIAAAFTRREIASGTASGAPYFDSVRRSWDAERSPDLMFVTKPWWIASGYPSGTTHGAPHEHDTHVPILLYGPPWVTSGRVPSPVDVSQLAPTLARLLGVPPPPASASPPLPLPR